MFVSALRSFQRFSNNSLTSYLEWLSPVHYKSDLFPDHMGLTKRAVRSRTRSDPPVLTHIQSLRDDALVNGK